MPEPSVVDDPPGEEVYEPFTVPDFFQEETSEARREQAGWLAERIGLGDAFFARVLRIDEPTFTNWRADDAELPAAVEETFGRFWWMMLHLFHYFSFDYDGIRDFFGAPFPTRPADDRSPYMYPPWGGTTPEDYLERDGADAIEQIDRWVTGFWAGNPWVD